MRLGPQPISPVTAIVNLPSMLAAKICTAPVLTSSVRLHGPPRTAQSLVCYFYICPGPKLILEKICTASRKTSFIVRPRCNCTDTRGTWPNCSHANVIIHAALFPCISPGKIMGRKGGGGEHTDYSIFSPFFNKSIRWIQHTMYIVIYK